FFWNGRDTIIKERFFGLNNFEGNHGEDVKELYYYLDNTPTHSYMKFLYKYPQREFPYTQLAESNRNGIRTKPEFEITDTGIFNDNAYFDIFIEYAKAGTHDILARLTVFNRNRDEARLHIIPQLWFRNTWSWSGNKDKPAISGTGKSFLQIDHKELGKYYFYFEGEPALLFCENETNISRLYGLDGGNRTFKDGINDYIVEKRHSSVNKKATGTKAALCYKTKISGHGNVSFLFRLSDKVNHNPFKDAGAIFNSRIEEAEAFYSDIQENIHMAEKKKIQRQAFAGMLWGKQFYYYDIQQWLKGDKGLPPPPPERARGRNSEWFHLYNEDIISMPDKWEYPWYAVWDLAFHTIPIAIIDPEFAKKQLLLLTREWYMHPNGQGPAYEWKFSDVNPPVHAWATWRVFKIDEKIKGKPDIQFLERVYHKLLLNFTWWVNKKDEEGRNIFQGGFLGMDNIGLFDRNTLHSSGKRLNQSDGTSWVAMFALNMMRISLELAKTNSSYQDMASKFFEHFLHIAGAMTKASGEGIGLWDEEDGFYYDVLETSVTHPLKIKIRSMVGLILLFAVEVLEPDLMAQMPEFEKRMNWFLNNQPELALLVSRWNEPGVGERRLLSLLRGSRMKKLLKRMLDENEFLSPYGIRSLSKYYKDNPYTFQLDGEHFIVQYSPAESETGMFGGNSNWRGPVWFPVNFLIIESLQRFHHYYGDDFRIEYPSGSGNFTSLKNVAEELTKRLTSVFIPAENNTRPVYGDESIFNHDPFFKDYILFYEYFNGDNGKGLGASHQTGWTGLVAKLIQPKKD
ncbi:MAG: glucosidase, partial [Bacteroidetes bacterium]|nr:glucosidase [Bacteroidota bacterium]